MPDSTSNYRPARVLIDSAAMRHNLGRVRELCPDAAVMAVIKADAYGHGMELAAQSLEGAEEFAVNSLDDVRRLRAIGVHQPITVLSANFDLEQLLQMQSLNVRPTVFDLSQLAVLEQLPADAALPVWLKVDTGMGRIGLLPDEFPSALERLKQVSGVSEISLMTHLANADRENHPGSALQLALFEELAVQGDFAELSVLNSAGCVSLSEAAHHKIRPGVMLYGISPMVGVSSATLELQPVMTFKSELISVRRMPSGSAIGYGSAYVLDQDSRIGIIAVGYGDGYPRHARNGTPVLVNGMLVPLVGRVSMDMIAVDLGQLPAQVGDEVILWGADNPIEDVAEAAGTIAYELCCGILPRVERITV